MYTEFYQLSDLPFQLTPDHRFFYGSSVHKRAMAHLMFGLSQGEGFIVITGDVGAGKTTLMGHLLETLDHQKYVSGTIVTTQLSGDDMLRMVAAAFDVDHANADKATLLQNLEMRFKSLLHEGKRCVLLIDEVQNLSFQALEELRMLSNFQVGGKALLQSFLLGQPQFRRTMASPDLDQLRQRVIVSYHLGPVEKSEIRPYIEHRLKAVGWHNDPEFTESAYAEIYTHTGGVPRKLNVLCSRLLLFGFLEETHQINRDAVVQVAEDLFRETEQILEHGEARRLTPSASAEAPPQLPTPAPPVSIAPPPPPPAQIAPATSTLAPAATAAPVRELEAAPTSAPVDAPSQDNAPVLDIAPVREAPVLEATEAPVLNPPVIDAQIINTPALIEIDSSPSAQSSPGHSDEEFGVLGDRVAALELQLERHERILRWTQLMLKHHERLLRRRTQAAASGN